MQYVQANAINSSAIFNTEFIISPDDLMNIKWDARKNLDK